MAKDNSGSYPNHPDPGPKNAVGNGKSIGTQVDLSKTANSVNSKTSAGTTGKQG